MLPIVLKIGLIAEMLKCGETSIFKSKEHSNAPE